MTHFEIMVEGAHAEIIDRSGILTSGMVGATVEFQFDSNWDGLLKTAVFKAANISRKQVGIESLTQIPHEVLRKSGYKLKVGVYGYRADGKVVIPTVWVDLDTIHDGADADCDPSVDPTPDEVEQLMSLTQEARDQAAEAQKSAKKSAAAAEKAAKSAAAAEPAAQRAEAAAQQAAQEAEKVAANAESLITAKVEEAVSQRTPITIVDITIPAEGWAALEGEEDYPLTIDVACEVARAVHLPQVTLHRESMKTAMVAGVCPAASAQDGAIRFWAEAQPAADMTATVALLTASTGTPGSGGTVSGDIASDEEVTDVLDETFGLGTVASDE